MYRLVLILLLFVSAAFADDWAKKFAVSGRPELRVETNDGTVTVRPGDSREIQARVTTVGWRIAPSEVRIIDRQNGDHVELEVRIPRNWGGINFGRRGVRIEIEVPRETRSDIRTRDGSITVEGLKGETRLQSGDGAIRAESVDGALDARTGDGKIIVRGRLDVLNLDTGDGGIEAEATSGSKMSSTWNVHSGDGHVRLRLPEGFSAELDAHTGDGHITVDFPITVSGLQRPSTVRGKMNGGGERLVVRTGDGSIQLQKL